MRRRASSGCNCMSKPHTRAQPEVGFIRPASIFSVVVFPAAFGPSIAKNSPRGAVSVTSLTATRSPNFLTRLMTSIMACVSRTAQLVEQRGHATRQFNAQNFAQGADVNDDRMVEHARFQTVGRHWLAAHPQPAWVGFPAERAGAGRPCCGKRRPIPIARP